MTNTGTRKTLVLGSAAVLALVALALIAFNGQSLVGFARAEYAAEVESAVGVNQYSSDVRVQGLRVGEVTAVETTGDAALVRFRVASDIDIHADATAALRLKNILGEKYLELDPGDAPEALSGPIPLSATETSTDLGAIIGAGSGPLSAYAPEDIASARAYAQSLANEYAPTGLEILASARDTVDGLAASTASGLGVIDDLDLVLATIAANRANIAETTANVEGLATALTEFADAHKPDLVRIFVSGIALRSVIDARAAEIVATGAEVPTAIALARTLVAYLVDNLENGGHTLPIGITNFGPVLERDYGVPDDGGGS